MARQFTFRGLMAPVFTAFKNDCKRTVDLEAIPKYASYLSNTLGLNGVLVNGTSGEGMSMSVNEREAVAEGWAKACQDYSLTMMLQIGGAPLPDVLRLTHHAEKLKVDALLCLPDLYFKPTNTAELVEYLQIVSEAAPNTPLLYYHIPSFTSVNVNMVEFLSQATVRIKTLVGIKFTSFDLNEGAACVQLNNGQYTIFLGADQILAGACALGFDSAIATTLNLFPQLSQTILKELTRNKESVVLPTVQNAQIELTRLVNHITKYGSWVSSMKAAMNILSPVQMGPTRSPLKELSDDQIIDMRAKFIELGYKTI